MIYPVVGVVAAILAGASGSQSFTLAAVGAILATITSAAIQAWRGRSQKHVEDATVLKLRQEAGKLLDERWQSIAERLDEEKDELLARISGLEAELSAAQAELKTCHTEIGDLRKSLDERAKRFRATDESPPPPAARRKK